jgi:hypothetical protein
MTRSLINEPPDQRSLVFRRNVALRQGQVVLGLADDDNSTSPRRSKVTSHPTLNYAFDDGAESVLRGECPFDSRDDVQERDYPGNLEDPFGDRHTPQHDIELATEFNGVFLRL